MLLMNSSEDFRFEVPILNSASITHHEVPVVYMPESQNLSRKVRDMPQNFEAMEENDCTIIENGSSDILYVDNTNRGLKTVHSKLQIKNILRDKINSKKAKELVGNVNKTVNEKGNLVTNSKVSYNILNSIVTNKFLENYTSSKMDNANADKAKDKHIIGNFLADNDAVIKDKSVTAISNKNALVIGVENIANLNDIIISEPVNNQYRDKSKCADTTASADVPISNKPNEQAQDKEARVPTCNINNEEDSVMQCINEPAIIIDEDYEIDNDCTIIEVENPHTVLKNSNNDAVHSFDDLQKENRLLTEIIEQCLDMENSDGMLRIINRTLIPLYKNADKGYKESDQFKKVLSDTIIKLKKNPDRKFSHIKALCELLKSGKVKKRVVLTTLQKKATRGRPRKKRTLFSSSTPKKKKKIDIISLDDDEDDVVQINCDSYTDIQINDVSNQITEDKSSSIQLNEDYETHVEISDSDGQVNDNPTVNEITDDVILIDDEIDCSDNSNKENNTIACNNERTLSETVLSKKRNEMLNLNNNDVTIDLSIEDVAVNSNKIFKPGEPPSLLIPGTQNTRTIEVIENEIATFVALIKDLEEREVYNDCYDSPYVLCDSYKAKVVELYKEICMLTGSDPVKKHTVRMKPEEGHHPGPIKIFEMFVNSNYDEEGNPIFPDLVDVINCVHAANLEYNLKWNKKQIEAEARALFIHYGRTVQKRRQQREWRHLLRYVKQEAPDPADEDLELQARLLENCKIAKKNEEELLARFADMESVGASNTKLRIPNPELRQSIERDDGDSNFDSTLPKHYIPNLPTERLENSGNSATMPKQTGAQNNGVLLLTTNLVNCKNIDRISLKSYDDSRTSGNVTNNVVIYNPLSVPVQVVAADNRTNGGNDNIITSMYNNFQVLIGSVQTPKSIEAIQHSNVSSSSFECFGTHKPQSANSSKDINKTVVDSTSKAEAYVQKSANVRNELTDEVTSNNTELNENNELKLTTNSNVSFRIEIEETDKDNEISEEINMGASSAKYEIDIDENNSLSEILTMQACSTRLKFEDANISVNNISTNYNENDDRLDEIPTNMENLTNIKIETENLMENIEANNTESKTNYSINIKFEDANENSENTPDLEQIMKHYNEDSEIDSDNSCQYNINEESTENESNSLLVKKEHLDIPRMLEELGDDFSATIIDIEDPFMVIEISDSSESEDDGD